MKKLLAIIFLLSAATCFANQLKDTPPIPLKGGSIPPHRKLQIDLSPLGEDGSYTAYTVNCDIYNSAYNKQYPVVLSMTGASATLNGKELGPNGQGKLDHYDNKYIATNVVYRGNPSVLDFYSFDNSDTVTVENCLATLMTSR